MKIIITILLYFIATGIATPQNHVSNIRVQQHDALLYVTYDLAEKSDIELFVSFDNGTNYRGPLKHVLGAVGKGVLPEKDKILVWDVMKEVGEVDYSSVVIKIVSDAGADVSDAPTNQQQKHPPFYVAIAGGASAFGECSFGEVRSGSVAVYMFDFAFLFNSNLGVGLKLNLSTCDVRISGNNVSFGSYNEAIFFIGPALYSRW